MGHCREDGKADGCGVSQKTCLRSGYITASGKGDMGHLYRSERSVANRVSPAFFRGSIESGYRRMWCRSTVRPLDRSSRSDIDKCSFPRSDRWGPGAAHLSFFGKKQDRT